MSHPVRHGEEEGFFNIEIRLKNENVSPGETLVKGMFSDPTQSQICLTGWDIAEGVLKVI